MEDWPPAQPKAKRRVWPWALGVVVLLAVIGPCLAHRDDAPSTGSSVSSAGSATTSRPSSQAYTPGREFLLDEFAISVPFAHTVEYVTSLGRGYSAKEVQDPGTYFCLVPVRIRNRTTSTATFFPSSWYLHADSYRFETATGMDYYLDEADRLDATDIPPGITRQGKIVFLVTSQAKYATKLVLELNDWGTKAWFDLSSL